MQISLSGKSALVTGATSGIGRAIAMAMAHAGAHVAINHLNQPKAAKALVDDIVATGGKAIAIAADVTSRTQVETMTGDVLRTFGQLDILVNNAGVILEKPFLELTDTDWDHVVDTDLKSVFLCCQAALPAMLHQGSGVIINIASDLAYLGRESYAPYCAAKAGVLGLTRALAREFAPAIRVNAIAPGPVATAMVSVEHMSPEMIERERAIPAARIAEPDEIASTAVFLASREAGFYYGQTFGPNGGSYFA